MSLLFSRAEADVFLPPASALRHGNDARAALARVTHLCVAAHQDDIEILAYDGICDCLDDPATRAFGGVVVTDGAGSARTGPYANYSDTQMLATRRTEQRTAAILGDYTVQLQLAHPSADVKNPAHPGVAADLATLFSHAKPEVVYLHQPADKHDTHVAVFLRCLTALRALPTAQRPRRVLGAEVWRDLDWLLDVDKVVLDSGRRPALAAALLAAFDSQISGGKRYDLAALGRRLAHATFHTAHATDRYAGLTWAMDLTPLISDPTRDVADFTLSYLERLRADIADRLRRFQ